MFTATKAKGLTGKSNYRYTPYTKTVWVYVRLRAMGITLYTPAPNPMYTQTPLHKLAKYL